MKLVKLIDSVEKCKHSLFRTAIALSSFAAVGTFSVSAPVQTATFDYFDGTFNDADWTRSIHFFAGPFGSVNETASQSLTDGNPDEFRIMTQSWGSGTSAFVFNFNNNAVYNPATQGAIASPSSTLGILGLGLLGLGLALKRKF